MDSNCNDIDFGISRIWSVFVPLILIVNTIWQYIHYPRWFDYPVWDSSPRSKSGQPPPVAVPGEGNHSAVRCVRFPVWREYLVFWGQRVRQAEWAKLPDWNVPGWQTEVRPATYHPPEVRHCFHPLTGKKIISNWSYSCLKWAHHLLSSEFFGSPFGPSVIPSLWTCMPGTQ